MEKRMFSLCSLLRAPIAMLLMWSYISINYIQLSELVFVYIFIVSIVCTSLYSLHETEIWSALWASVYLCSFYFRMEVHLLIWLHEKENRMPSLHSLLWAPMSMLWIRSYVTFKFLSLSLYYFLVCDSTLIELSLFAIHSHALLSSPRCRNLMSSFISSSLLTFILGWKYACSWSCKKWRSRCACCANYCWRKFQCCE